MCILGVLWTDLQFLTGNTTRRKNNSCAFCLITYLGAIYLNLIKLSIENWWVNICWKTWRCFSLSWPHLSTAACYFCYIRLIGIFFWKNSLQPVLFFLTFSHKSLNSSSVGTRPRCEKKHKLKRQSVVSLFQSRWHILCVFSHSTFYAHFYGQFREWKPEYLGKSKAGMESMAQHMFQKLQWKRQHISNWIARLS